MYNSITQQARRAQKGFSLFELMLVLLLLPLLLGSLFAVYQLVLANFDLSYQATRQRAALLDTSARLRTAAREAVAVDLAQSGQLTFKKIDQTHSFYWTTTNSLASIRERIVQGSVVTDQQLLTGVITADTSWQLKQGLLAVTLSAVTFLQETLTDNPRQQAIFKARLRNTAYQELD